MSRFPFNVRVYGALIFKGKILLCDEEHDDLKMTKLPGGGLEFGEGLHDAVKREFFEETGFGVDVLHHIYTTDFFQLSAFDSRDQIISVYYRVSPNRPGEIDVNTAFRKGEIGFRWKKLEELSESDFTMPIDKVVAPMLRGLR